MTPITESQIKELCEDPTLVAIYAGTVISELRLPVIYDHDFDPDILAPEMLMEPEEEVIVTEHNEGLFFIHFLSLTPKRYHYKAPWISDDQVTHDEGALYHV